jgi:hypothetical protein
MISRFAAVRVRCALMDFERTEPREEEWLLIEWPEGACEPTRYWFSTMPRKTSIKKLVYFAKLRFRIECGYEEFKQEIGLGHYEGRKWRGFHHHATMCIAAYAFLIAERGLFSQEKLEINLDSRNLGFPEVKDPEAAPVRPGRHNPTSIATLRKTLIVTLVQRLPRCPCCQRRNDPFREAFDELIE